MRRLRKVPGEAGNFVLDESWRAISHRECVGICNLGPFLWPLYLPGVEAAHIAKCPAARLPEAKVLAISRSPADLVERKEGTAPWGKSYREI